MLEAICGVGTKGNVLIQINDTNRILEEKFFWRARLDSECTEGAQDRMELEP